jgi:serine protease Do
MEIARSSSVAVDGSDLPAGRSAADPRLPGRRDPRLAQPFRRGARLTFQFISGGHLMKVSRWGALTGALVLASAIAPSAVVHGQGRNTVVRTLDMFGRTARIGVTVQDVDNEDAKQPKGGVVIEDVRTGGPADKAGMKTGDAIVEFDGDRVRSVRQFTRLVQESAPGRSVPVVLSRGGNRVTVNVTPENPSLDDDFNFRLLDGARVRPTPPPPPPAARAPLPPAFDNFFWIAGRRALGVTLESLDDQLAEYFGVKDGVLVKSVEKDSAAQKAGIKAGDVITAVNGRKIYETSDVNRAIDRSDAAAEFTIDLVRDKKPQTVKGKLESPRSRARGVPTIL